MRQTSSNLRAPFLMTDEHIEVLGLGNSLVDLFAHIEEDFLVKESMQKGAMILIDEERAEQLYKRMGPATIVSGGSAANTIAGVRRSEEHTSELQSRENLVCRL